MGTRHRLNTMIQSLRTFASRLPKRWEVLLLVALSFLTGEVRGAELEGRYVQSKGQLHGVSNDAIRGSIGKITQSFFLEDEYTYTVHWLFEPTDESWKSVNDLTYNHLEGDFNKLPREYPSDSEVKAGLGLRRRMAQREFSSRRDSPTMVRLLEQI